MLFADQSGLLGLIRSPLGIGESDHAHLLEILSDFKHRGLSKNNKFSSRKTS